jgi:hypothetical protein
MKTVKQMRKQIKDKYSAIPEQQVTPGIYIKTVGSKYVTLLNTWGITHFNKIEISEFYESHVQE